MSRLYGPRVMGQLTMTDDQVLDFVAHAAHEAERLDDSTGDRFRRLANVLETKAQDLRLERGGREGATYSAHELLKLQAAVREFLEAHQAAVTLVSPPNLARVMRTLERLRELVP